MTNKQKIKALFSILEEAEAYKRTIEKLDFDLQCCAPEEGMEKAGDDMSIIGIHLDKILHSKRYEKLVCELHENSEGLSPLQKKAVEYLYEDHLKIKNLSADFSYKMSVACNNAYSKWISAKKVDDFAIFKDSFAEVIDYTRQSVDKRETRHGSYYDNLLDDFEKDGNEKQLDKFFKELKDGILPLLAQIKKNGKSIRNDFLCRPCPITEQEKFSKYLLNLEGLRDSALVLMTTEHPFTTNFGPHDVRVTTHYYEDNFISNIFSTLHEGGHALFMQNEPDEFYENHVNDRMSNAMHECISRFFENIIGRSEAFIKFIYPKLCEISPEIMKGVSERELYEAVNIAEPGLIRMEADELTYSLHIMIRYEIEKKFVNGEITVDEIPSLWNKMYKEYLGVTVPSDSVGCLQDVHWTGGYGYFPSYALGNAYGVQILRTMQKDFDVYAEVEKGNLNKVSDWLIKNVFSIASISSPDEWIKKITGEGLNTVYFLDYLRDKFSDIYKL